MKKTLLAIILLQTLAFAHAESNAERVAYENGYNFAIETHYRLAYVEKQQEQDRRLIEQQRNALAGEKYQIYQKMAELKASDRVVAWGSLLMVFFSIIMTIGGVIVPIILYRRNQELYEEIQEEKEAWEEERQELKKIIETLSNRVNGVELYEGDELLADISREMLRTNTHVTLDDEQHQQDLSDIEKEIINADSQKLAEQARESQSPRQFLQSAQLSYATGDYSYALQQVNQALALLKEKQGD